MVVILPHWNAARKPWQFSGTVQVDRDKLKRQVDLFTEALTAVDDRYQAEVRLGGVLNELRGMGLNRADIAERTGLTLREFSAAMRAAKEAEAPAAGDENEPAEAEEVTSSDSTTNGAKCSEVDAALSDDAARDAI